MQENRLSNTAKENVEASIRGQELCGFCTSRRIHAYFLNGYDLQYCRSCGTIGVLDPPDEKFLRDFYQGFSFQASLANLERIQTPQMREWMAGLLTAGYGTMLDFGGGGGFFAKAFEEFGLGQAYYVDFDEAACHFASTSLGLERVYCGSLSEVRSLLPVRGFDFIMCRHVIEHLIDPASVIAKLACLLKETGVLVLSCPNGSSKEGLFYPAYWKKFLGPVARENGWSKAYALKFSLTRKYGWGISPPRHLWAITGDGLKSVIERDGRFLVRIETASLANDVYSPYWRSIGRFGKIRDFFCDSVFGSAFEGVHLIAFIRRKHNQSA